MKGLPMLLNEVKRKPILCGVQHLIVWTKTSLLIILFKSLLKFSLYLGDLSEITGSVLVSHYNHIFDCFPFDIHLS